MKKINFVLKVLIIALSTITFLTSTSSVAFAATTPSITVKGHCQDIGWQSSVTATVGNVVRIGTTGQSKRLEAFTATVSEGGITYRAHVQDIGWQSWVSNGSMAGTKGQSKAIEAVEMKLTGSISNSYDLYYRVHVKDFGYLSWTKNGSTAGSTGASLQIEAIEFKLVAKGTGPSVNSSSYLNTSLTYRTHCQDIGWQSYRSSNEVAGTTGQGKRMEALQISLMNMPGSSISYSTHVSDIGWTSYVSNGAVSGTTGQSKAIEAVKISLSGPVATYFDVYYRIHSANIGWLGWACNGQIAGTTGYGYQAEAIQIILLPKGSNTLSVGNSYKEKTNTSVSTSTSTVSSKVNSFINDSRFCVGTAWGYSKTPQIEGSEYGTGCYSYASDFANYVYGSQLSDGSAFYSANEIHAGDVVHVKNSGHWFVVLARNGNTLDIIHGNWTNGTVCRTTATINGELINFGNQNRNFDVGYHY